MRRLPRLPLVQTMACRSDNELGQIMACRLFGQAIICTNAAFFLIGPLRTTFGEIWIKTRKFVVKKNAFGNAVYKLAEILSRLQPLPPSTSTHPHSPPSLPIRVGPHHYTQITPRCQSNRNCPSTRDRPTPSAKKLIRLRNCTQGSTDEFCMAANTINSTVIAAGEPQLW